MKKEVKEITLPIKLPSSIPCDKEVVFNIITDITEKCLKSEISAPDLYASILGLVQFFALNVDEEVNPISVLYDMISDLKNIADGELMYQDKIEYLYNVPTNKLTILGKELNVDLTT